MGSADECFRVLALRILQGVDWPTASVLLHFGVVESYPILDYRALWSLGWKRPPTYTFPFWMAYVQYCRNLARQNHLSMRQLDRALWNYSKQHQGVT